MTTSKSNTEKKLPPKKEDQIVEVNFREVVIGFLSVSTATFFLVSSLMFVRDFLKYKRQGALIQGAIQIINKVKDGGIHIEKD